MDGYDLVNGFCLSLSLLLLASGAAAGRPTDGREAAASAAWRRAAWHPKASICIKLCSFAWNEVHLLFVGFWTHLVEWGCSVSFID